MYLTRQEIAELRGEYERWESGDQISGQCESMGLVRRICKALQHHEYIVLMRKPASRTVKKVLPPNA